MSRRALVVAILLLVAGALARFVGRVPDDEMAPSLLPGDLILVLPLAATEGDVVAVVDPLASARWTLRRVEAIGGAARYDGRVFRTSNRPKTRLLDMGRYRDRPVHLEGPHLVLRALEPTEKVTPEVGIPDDAAYLGADNRDDALDSRWWGPVPLTALRGVVVARLGLPTTPWRGWFGARGEAAVVPQSSRLGPPAS